MVVRDDDVSLVVESVAKAARTGEMADGKIFMLPGP
ncbi:MAG: P-II family nitrogen regulator [Halobacteriota archaeon]